MMKHKKAGHPKAKKEPVNSTPDKKAPKAKGTGPTRGKKGRTPPKAKKGMDYEHDNPDTEAKPNKKRKSPEQFEAQMADTPM